VSKRKKTSPGPAPLAAETHDENQSVTTQASVPADVIESAVADQGSPLGDEGASEAPSSSAQPTDAKDLDGELASADELLDLDSETTVNLSGSDLPLPGRDDLDAPTVAASSEELAGLDGVLVQRKHLRGLLEALVFASDSPIKPGELAKLASAQLKQVKELLGELKQEYATRGMHLDEVAGGWCFRTSAQYAPFIRDLTKQKPVRLTRAQVETLAIIAYRQPITRPEVDDVRGVDSGPVLKLLLERDLVRILGKRDEPGRPLIYGTTPTFLEFFGLRSLKDLPTLREFTELTDESRQTYEDELGEAPHEGSLGAETAEAPILSGDEVTAIRTDDELPSTEDAPTHADDGETRAPAESMRVPIRDAAEEIPAELEETHAAARHGADGDDATLMTRAPTDDDAPAKSEE
jgi:segregation and condensation protein B